MSDRTRTFSARLDTGVLGRLDRRGQQSGVSKSRLAERYIDEGLRMESHPGIVFKGGPSGRRAALATGPDVWQVVEVLKAGDRDERGIEETAKWLDLTPERVRAAVRYYAEFPEEIDEHIRRNKDQADAAEAAWRREQEAIAG